MEFPGAGFPGPQKSQKAQKSVVLLRFLRLLAAAESGWQAPAHPFFGTRKTFTGSGVL
jgi:hypothetical protein